MPPPLTSKNPIPLSLRPLLQSLFLTATLTALPLHAQQDSQSLSGTVVDAVSGQAIARALVRLGGGNAQRAVLTDPLGHFTFPNVDPANLNITAIKPGYNFNRSLNDASELFLKPEALTEPVELRLYPEAILKGAITTPDGNPLPDIAIQALRAISDDSGTRFVPVAATRSNAHGQFRLLLPGGDYRIETGYASANAASAVLPVIIPGLEASAEASIHLQPGEQHDLDLRPQVVPLYDVTARLNLSPDEINSLTATTSTGATFSVSFRVTGAGQIETRLPAGSFTLQARRHNFGADGLDQATLNVIPSATQPIALSLQFTPVSSIPIEILIDDAAQSAATSAGRILTVPNARALGLSLEPAGDTPVSGDFSRPSQRRGDEAVSFLEPPGTYRVHAQPFRTWAVLSASFGGTDVLAHDLLVASGSAATPLQLVVSNQLATLHGNITLAGKPASCWIYLLATTPSATPILTLHSGEDGTFYQSAIPPGSYRALAFEHRHTFNSQVQQAISPFTTHLGAVTLAAGENATLNLEAVADAELHP